MQSNHWEKLTLLNSKKDQITEFKKKYMDTFLFFGMRGSPERKLIRFVDASEDRFMLKDPETEAEYVVTYDSDIELTASFPTTRLVNGYKGFYLFTRIPQRQYLKAPNHGNAKFLNPLKLPETLEPSFYFKMLKATYNSFYSNLDSVQYTLPSDGNKEVVGRAVSPKFAVSCAPDTDEHLLLWYLDTVVGYIKNKNEIMCVNSAFRQEIIDFLNREKYTNWSVV